MLAVETSCGRASAAVFEGDTCLSERFTEEGKKHAETVLPLIEQILTDTDTPLSAIDRYAVCIGPGSFTGVRIGVSTVNAMAYAAGKPVVPVDALRALYEGVLRARGDAGEGAGVGRVAALIDAGGGRAYGAVYERGAIVLLPSAVDIAPFLAEYGENAVVTGDAGGGEGEKRYPSASLVGYAALQLAETARATPLYVRLPQAERNRKGSGEQG